MSDLTLNAGAITAVGLLLTCLCGAIGFQYRAARDRERELTAALVAAKDSEISRSKETTDRLMGMLDRLIPAVEDTSRQVQRLVSLFETWRPGKRE